MFFTDVDERREASFERWVESRAFHLDVYERLTLSVRRE